MTTSCTSFEEVLNEALEDPEVRKEWDRTQLARDVAFWLVLYRKQHKLTQTQLAELLGWQQSVVARLESGEREPSIATLHHLVERLGTTATIDIRPERVQVRIRKPRRAQRPATARRAAAPKTAAKRRGAAVT